MNLVANQTELVFEIAGVAANEGSAWNNQACSEFGGSDRLLNGKTAYRLDRHFHGGNDLSQLIERTGIWHSQRREAAALVVAAKDSAQRMKSCANAYRHRK